ncbi:MAG: MCE family protein [Acidimicrobiales bacterium]
MGRLRLVALVAVVGLGTTATACNLQTGAAPKGPLTLTALFNDVSDLTPGHTVQVSNVIVGSVAAIELDGYQAEVTLSIVEGRRVPQGTAAVVRRTSILGEHFVDLVFPEGYDPDAGPFLESGARIEETEVTPELEQLAQYGSELLGAVATEDISAIVDAGAEGLGGRGATLNRLIVDVSHLVGALAEQQTDLAAAVDGLGRLGASLAPASEDVGTLIDNLVGASGVLAENRGRFIAAVEDLTELATVTNRVVLEPHAERLGQLLAQLDPIAATLVANQGSLESLLANFLAFTQTIDDAIHEGQLLLFVWIYLPALFGQTGPGSQAAAADPVQGLVDLLGPGGSGP